MREFIVFVLSMTILAGYAYISYVLAIGDKEATATANLVYGSVSAMSGSVLTYWFGSTKGSSDKDKTINSLAKGNGQ